jgi:uncharacterized protein YfaS (alpha-2-macroglobulin family)
MSTPSLVLAHALRPVAQALLLASLLAACGDDDGRPSSGRDRNDNGVVAIDEALIHGDVVDGVLTLDIPLRSVAATPANGELDVTLRAVGADTAAKRTSVRYGVAAHDEVMLHASLAMPDEIEDQPGLVAYVVRIEQGSDRPLRVTRSLLHVLTPVEVRLEGPAKLRAEKPAIYRAVVQNARTRAALANQTVKLRVIHDADGTETLESTSDDAGVARFELPALDPGSYTVEAVAVTGGVELAVSEGITIEAPARKILLTSDKPIYQPGQTIHLRALALENPANTPLAETDVVMEVEDGKGNKIMKRTLVTDEHGIAATTFRLANILNMGNFKLRAIAADVTTEKTVQVSRYVLPKFEVKLSADRGYYTPGQTVHGTLDARYFFGKDVASGQVVVEGITLDVGENVFARVMGQTDAQGSFDFELALPATLAGIPLQDGNALVTVRATVSDTAGQEVTKELALTVADQAVRLSLVPESSALVPGLENRLHLFASDPLGGPVVGAAVSVLPQGGEEVSGETDAFGHLGLAFTPDDTNTTVTVNLEDDGDRVSQTFSFGQQEGDEHVLVRTDKAIYALGESVKVLLFGSDPNGTVYVDWLNAGQTVDIRTLQLEDGQASFDMALDTALLGDNRIEAYVVDDAGNLVRAGRSIVVKGDSALSVSLETDKPEYRPGEPAELTFSVVDEEGEPTVAALGVQIVDEAVFALIDARPGLLKTYFEIEDAFAAPTYEIHGPVVSFEQLLFQDTAPGAEPDVHRAAQDKAEAALASLAARSMMGVSKSSWAATLQEAHALLEPKLEAEGTRLAKLFSPIVQRELETLVADGCKIDESWCEALQMDLASALQARVEGKLSAVDFWGREYVGASPDYGDAAKLRSSGPDEIMGNEDDEAVAVSFADLDLDLEAVGGSQDGGIGFDPGIGVDDGDFGNEGPGAPVNGGGAAAGAGGSGGAPDPEPMAEGSGSPRVRREFPETLYVNPSIITGADGKATVSLDMADSITEWRVSALANSASGKLGGGQSGIRVFQDFFVDVSFPAELTRGDEVQFPVVVYNYLDEAQSVALTLEAATWYTALGATEQTVELAAGEVKAVRFPVRVDEVGTQSLTVEARGADASDAVARAVRVIPDGQEVALPQSGSLAPGDETLSVGFPADAVPGSQQLYVEVYPAFLSQAVSGLDSILAEPSGCFEQTTSTTWPNVLVTSYMKETGQGTPEIELKAESFISAGYQRLLTFEHDGGGFSWFGMEDPEPYLSVTAFGLMEFADMAAVHEVDAAMIERTESYLVSQQQADGSWAGDMTEFFSFHTSGVRNTAFTLWALAQNGYDGPEMQRGLDYVEANLGSEDPDGYTLALVANAFVAATPDAAFTSDLIEQLDAAKTEADGIVTWDSGDTQTQFYAEGDDATVTATALAAHALLLAGGYASSVNGALAYLASKKDANGNFGSTQATVWTLKTLLLSALKGTEGAVGSLEVALDGETFQTVELTEDEADVMTLVDMSALATTGDHEVTLTFAGEGKVSYNLVARHHVPWASVPAEPTGPLAIELGYDRTSLVVDETVKATVTVGNTTDDAQSMILVTLGIPPGFEVLTEDLDPYIEQDLISRHERTGKQLIVYLSSLEPNESRVIEYRLRATMPVRAVDGGAEAHLYYQPEQRTEAPAQELSADES